MFTTISFLPKYQHLSLVIPSFGLLVANDSKKRFNLYHNALLPTISIKYKSISKN